MNCKKGDLAIVVGGNFPENYGRVVEVLYKWEDDHPEFTWRTSVLPNGVFLARDKCLRPLRNEPGQDETLTWAGKPEKVTS